MPQGPLFLARAVYRRRRLRDAGRLLPVLGLLLLILPGLGHAGTESAGQTAVYIFAVWALLIAAAAALAPGLSRTEGEADPVEDPLDPSGDPR